jgi:excinuclease UvrABC ATPase subunit
LILVHGARVNNLNDVSVEIPKRRLTVFTGVSGSGKSSLVFGTVARRSAGPVRSPSRRAA